MGSGLRGFFDELKLFAAEITDDEVVRRAMWERASPGATAYYRFNHGTMDAEGDVAYSLTDLDGLPDVRYTSATAPWEPASVYSVRP